MLSRYYSILLCIFILWACEKQPAPATGTVPVTPGTGGSSSVGDLRTVFSNDWDSWDYSLDSISGSVRTVFSNDWDNWNISIGNLTMNMRTVFAEDWDNWQLNAGGQNISLRTAFTDDWDNWQLKDNNTGDLYYIRTSFPDDWDSWEVYLNGSLVMNMRTDFSNDFDNWSLRNYGLTNNVHKSCILFLPVFISAVHQQGIIGQ